jgi:hypothetical protein
MCKQICIKGQVVTESLGSCNNFEWYAEWVYYEDKEELKDAEEYLRLWMKFILKRLRSLKYVDHTIIHREFHKIESLGSDVQLPKMMHTLAIKLQMEKLDV